MALNVKYGDRSITWGNEALVVAKFDESGKVDTASIKVLTGLVSVGAMEDQAEVQNYPADDIADHATKKGATLLNGELVFLQTDEALKEELLGQVAATNGLGYVQTGQYPNRIIQYVQRTQTKKADGTIGKGYKIQVLPNVQATAELSFESETDSSDGVDPIQYTLAIQATATDNYVDKGFKPAQQEFVIDGDNVELFEEKFTTAPFVFMPDTTLTATE